MFYFALFTVLNLVRLRCKKNYWLSLGKHHRLNLFIPFIQHLYISGILYLYYGSIVFFFPTVILILNDCTHRKCKGGTLICSELPEHFKSPQFYFEGQTSEEEKCIVTRQADSETFTGSGPRLFGLRWSALIPFISGWFVWYHFVRYCFVCGFFCSDVVSPKPFCLTPPCLIFSWMTPQS